MEQEEVAHTNMSASATQSLTEGMIVMNIGFNPDRRKDVDHIKRWCALQYDFVSEYGTKRIRENQLTEHRLMNHIASLRIRALDQLENFQMMAVEAVTRTEDLTDVELGYNFKNPTPGERAMTADFNIGGNELVNRVKTECVKMFDYLNLEAMKRAKWLDEKRGQDSIQEAERAAEMMTTRVLMSQNMLVLFRQLAVKLVTR